MTQKQIQRLLNAMDLLREITRAEIDTKEQIIVRLLMAGDYCREVTEELRDAE